MRLFVARTGFEPISNNRKVVYPKQSVTTKEIGTLFKTLPV